MPAVALIEKFMYCGTPMSPVVTATTYGLLATEMVFAESYWRSENVYVSLYRCAGRPLVDLERRVQPQRNQVARAEREVGRRAEGMRRLHQVAIGAPVLAAAGEVRRRHPVERGRGASLRASEYGRLVKIAVSEVSVDSRADTDSARTSDASKLLLLVEQRVQVAELELVRLAQQVVVGCVPWRAKWPYWSWTIAGTMIDML